MPFPKPSLYPDPIENEWYGNPTNELILDSWEMWQTSEATKKKLVNCSFKDEGMMSDIISSNTYRMDDYVVALWKPHAKTKKPRIIGWGLKYGLKMMIHIYSNHRRKGYGSLIYRELKKFYQPGQTPVVFKRHTHEAKQFWESKGL